MLLHKKIVHLQMESAELNPLSPRDTPVCHMNQMHKQCMNKKTG